MISSIQQSKQSCRWHRRKEERPAEILTAAMKIFAKKGFAATKLEIVAKEAGISKATLYLYFEGKEALFKAVVTEFVLPQIERAEDQAKSNTGPVKDLIYDLLEQWRVNFLETNFSGIPKIMVAEASNFPELANFYLENIIKRARKFLVNLIELGIKKGEFRECNAHHAARSFISTIIFTAIWRHSLSPFDETYDTKAFLNSHLEIFIRGIRKDAQQ